MSPQRRRLLFAALASAGGAGRAEPDGAAAEAALRAGGVVIAFRHALAPGTFDPPGFELAKCATQRNLSDEGRAQARRLGAWFEARGLRPDRVRSSPWCRCLDTARLAFGRTEAWPALGSPYGTSERTNAESLAALRAAVAAVAAERRGGFELWVTHMFVLSALAGTNTGSGEGLVLAHEDGAVRVLARLVIP